MAPELVLKKEFNAEAVDIWALGISFFQITTGTLPWVTPQVAKEIMAGFVFIPNEIDPQISQLLRKMLQAEPSRRPTSSQLLQLPIFNNDNTDQYQPTLTTMPLKQMSFIAPAISSFNSNKMTTSASIINHKSRRKMKNQVFSKKRVSLSYTFSEDETPEPNNVSDSFLK